MKKFLALLLVALLITSTVILTSCIWGPTIAYHWQVESHSEFVERLERFNSIHDEFVNTFISFDLDEKEDVSKTIYHFGTIANKSAVYKYDLCDKVCSTFNVEFVCYLKSNIENDEHNDHAYKIACYYSEVGFNFSENDKIEIQKCNTYGGEEQKQCNVGGWYDMFYQDAISGNLLEENRIYNYSCHYELFVNGIEFACIHISSIEEASEEKLNEIIQMLSDSLVILNTEN